MASAEATPASRYLTFRVGSRRYALPATEVTEVVRVRSLARVPQGPPSLLGVTNLRGNIVAVVGLRELLKQGGTPELEAPLSLLLDQAAPIALVIDSIESLHDVPGGRIERADEAWTDADGERIRGVFKDERSDEPTKILDIDALLAEAFKERPAGRRERAVAGAARRTSQAQVDHSAELLLTFEVAEQEFAFTLSAVEELLPLPASIAAVSRPDAVMLGFASIREALVPLLSLRGLLGFEAAVQATGREKVLVLTVGGAPVGLVVDEAREIVAAALSAMEPVPAVLTARTGGEARIRSVYRGEGGRRLISILAPELLFRDDIMQRLAKVTQNVPIQHKTKMAEVQDEVILLAFRLGDDEFGLPIDAVVEVAPVPTQITRVPKTPKFLEGVVNLRGDVLPVVDQRRRFDMPPLAEQTRRLVVVKTAGLRAGIIVDSVTDVLRTVPAAISPPPELTAQISRLVYGVVNLEASRRLVLLLDPTELLTRAELGQLDTFQTQSKKARA